MNQRAFLAVMLAVCVPLVAYFIVKWKSDHTVLMPRHYIYDTVQEVVRKNKKVNDTVWHQVSDFSLVNQQNQPVTYDSLHGKIIVADFFFTHCPTICPGMTKNMKRLAESINNGEKVGDRINTKVHFLSFSVDPERDTVERLKYWADKYQINPINWWLLTGPKKTIYDLAFNDLKLGIVDGQGVDTSFMHSEKFVLLDSNRYVRGYYDGTDSASLAKLSEDLILLTMEKGKKSKGVFDGKLELIAIVFLIAIAGLALFVYFFRKNK